MIGLQRVGFDPTPVVSSRMRRVRRADTTPEVKLRRALWRKGHRFFKDRRVAGVHVDIAFPTHKLALFVDGCFWHGCPQHWNPPRKNAAYWRQKHRVVDARDARNDEALIAAGWSTMRIWEHEIARDVGAVAAHVERQLDCR